jgi:hypothetical protein
VLINNTTSATIASGDLGHQLESICRGPDQGLGLRTAKRTASPQNEHRFKQGRLPRCVLSGKEIKAGVERQLSVFDAAKILYDKALECHSPGSAASKPHRHHNES